MVPSVEAGTYYMVGRESGYRNANTHLISYHTPTDLCVFISNSDSSARKEVAGLPRKY